MPSYTLHYFDARSRGEVIRLLFTYVGQAFEDIRFNWEQWLEFKPKTPFGQVPVLEIDGKMYGQSLAISNHLARQFGLYGKTLEDSFAIDRITNLISDFRQAAYKGTFEKDEALKAEMKKKFEEDELPKYLGSLENLLKEQSNGHFVGSDVTLADLAVYDFIWDLQQHREKVLDSYPEVKGHLEKIGSVPQIKAYVDARKTTIF